MQISVAAKVITIRKLSYVVKRYLVIPFFVRQYSSHADKSSPVVGMVSPNTNMKLSVAAATADLRIIVNPGASVIMPLDRMTTVIRVEGTALLATTPTL